MGSTSKKLCRECQRLEFLGRGGRCRKCGIQRVLLTTRWMMALKGMPNARIEHELIRLEARSGAISASQD